MAKEESPADMALRIIRVAELLAKTDVPQNTEVNKNSSSKTRDVELDVKFYDQSEIPSKKTD